MMMIKPMCRNESRTIYFFFPLTIFFPLLDKAIFISASFNDSLWNIVALLRFVLQLDFLFEDDLEQKNSFFIQVETFFTLALKFTI